MSRARSSLPSWCLIFLLSIPFAHTSAGASGSQWFRIETAHFTVLSQSDAEVGRRLAADLERLHHTLTELAPSDHLESPLPNYFYVFSDPRELDPYQQAGTAMDSRADGWLEVIGGAGTAGYLASHESGNFAVLVGGDGFVPTRYAYKQYIHHRLLTNQPNLPLWFRQGVAEYFSSFKTENEQALIGLPSEGHLDWLRNRPEPLIPIAELIQFDASGIAKRPHLVQRQYFNQSWALFHYLQNGRTDTRDRTPRYVQEVALGKGLVAAFEEAYELSPTVLDQELLAYVNGDSLSYLRIPVEKLDLLVTRTRTLEAHETEFHLGELAAKGALKTTLAESHFKNALQLSPEHGPSWSGLGFLAEEAGRLDDARAAYAKAAELSPDDFYTSYLYGRSLLQTLQGRPTDDVQKQTLDDAIQHLQRSVDLQDEFAEAWARLGYAYGLHSEPSEAGVVAMKRAYGYFPDRTDLALNLLLAHARRGERQPAEEIYREMVQLGVDEAGLGRAREIRLQMDYRDAAKKVRSGDTDEAIALFARIHHGTTNPQLKAQVAAQLEKLSVVDDFNAFIELYNRAAEAVNAGRIDQARTLVEQLDGQAVEPWQKGQVKKLRRALTADKTNDP